MRSNAPHLMAVLAFAAGGVGMLLTDALRDLARKIGGAVVACIAVFFLALLAALSVPGWPAFACLALAGVAWVLFLSEVHRLLAWRRLITSLENRHASL